MHQGDALAALARERNPAGHLTMQTRKDTAPRRTLSDKDGPDRDVHTTVASAPRGPLDR